MDPLEDGDPRSVGPFTIEGRLGSGGMGQVFFGRDAAGRPAAVKLINASLARDPQFRARFVREVQAAQRVQGPGLAAVIAADPVAQRPWMATEFIGGGTLHDTLNTYGPMPAHAVLDLAARLGVALGAVHRSGVIHRDLKPQNVIISSSGPVLIDFGIARALDASTLTHTGVITGSAGFMSPEQASGDGVTPASDVFSLGALLFYASTGEPPFGLGAMAEQAYRVVHRPANLGRVDDPLLRALIAACLMKDPARRVSSDQVTAIASGQAPPPQLTLEQTEIRTPAGVPKSAAPHNVWRTGAFATLSVAILGFLVAGGILLAQSRDGVAASSGTDTPSPSASTSAPSGTTPISTPSTSLPVVPATTVPPTIGVVTPSNPVPGPTFSLPLFPSSPADGSGSSGSGSSGSGASSSVPSVVSVSLATSGSMTAKVYFGQLSAVTSKLSNLTLNVAPALARAHPSACVETVVFDGVGGDQAAVYAQNLGTGWGGAEHAPDQSPAQDDGAVHQQLLVPPTTSTQGDSWTAWAYISVDGTKTPTSAFSLTLVKDGSTPTWKLGSKPVKCKLF